MSCCPRDQKHSKGETYLCKEAGRGTFLCQIVTGKRKKNHNPVYFADAAQDLVFFTEKKSTAMYV